MEALEFIGIVDDNGNKVLTMSSPDFQSNIRLKINTLVDMGAFEDINDRSGHRFLLNGNELRVLHQGAVEDQYPEIIYRLEDISIQNFFEEGDYELLVAHLQMNLMGPIQGGRRSRRQRKVRKGRSRRAY